MLPDEGDPLTYKEEKLCEHKKKWELAMQEEIKSLHATDTWDLVELPKGRKAIPNKWVYKIKTVDGKPKYKARLRDMRKKRALISKSFSLQWLKWPNYVSCFPTAALDLELFQMDVKKAFLHVDLDKEL